MGWKGEDSACLHPRAVHGHRPLLPQLTGHRPRPAAGHRRGYDLEPRTLSRRLRQDTDSSTRDAHAAICGQSTASDGPAPTPRAPGAAERRHARAGRVRRSMVPSRSWALTAARLAPPPSLEFTYFYRALPTPPPFPSGNPSLCLGARCCLPQASTKGQA